MQNPQDFQRDLLSASIDSIGGEPLDGSGFEAQEPDPAFTAAELNGVPSWNCTPLRSVNVRVKLWLENAQLVASPAEMTPFAFSLSSVSKTGIINSKLEGNALVCGS